MDNVNIAVIVLTVAQKTQNRQKKLQASVVVGGIFQKVYNGLDRRGLAMLAVHILFPVFFRVCFVRVFVVHIDVKINRLCENALEMLAACALWPLLKSAVLLFNADNILNRDSNNIKLIYISVKQTAGTPRTI
jgi:hypothetical protein